MQATVSSRDVPGGAEVVIEYEDGHTVRMSLGGADSIVLQMHLGIVDPAAPLTRSARGA